MSMHTDLSTVRAHHLNMFTLQPAFRIPSPTCGLHSSSSGASHIDTSATVTFQSSSTPFAAQPTGRSAEKGRTAASARPLVTASAATHDSLAARLAALSFTREAAVPAEDGWQAAAAQQLAEAHPWAGAASDAVLVSSKASVTAGLCSCRVRGSPLGCNDVSQISIRHHA